MNADKTERRWGLGLHALGFLASLAAVFALAALVYFPLRAQEESLDRQLAAAWKLLGDAREISAAHEAAAAELKEAEERIRRVHEQIPQGAEEATFMSQLGRLAADAGFEVLDYRPGSAEPHRFCQQIRVHVRGRATYGGVCRFLGGLDQLPRVCRTTDLKVDAAGTEDACRVEMTLLIFFGTRREALDAITESRNG